MAYKDRFTPKGDYGDKAPIIPRGPRLIPLSEKTARCSACNRVFVVKTDDATDLQKQFEAHKCNPTEDASQAAARVVKEATENH